MRFFPTTEAETDRSQTFFSEVEVSCNYANSTTVLHFIDGIDGFLAQQILYWDLTTLITSYTMTFNPTDIGLAAIQLMNFLMDLLL